MRPPRIAYFEVATIACELQQNAQTQISGRYQLREQLRQSGESARRGHS